MTAPAAIQDDAPVRVGTGDTVEYQRASMREPLVGIVACQSPLTGLITLDDGTDLIPSRDWIRVRTPRLRGPDTVTYPLSAFFPPAPQPERAPEEETPTMPDNGPAPEAAPAASKPARRTRQCECGAEFPVRAANQIRCPACQEAATRRGKREYAARIAARDRVSPGACRRCGETFDKSGRGSGHQVRCKTCQAEHKREAAAERAREARRLMSEAKIARLQAVADRGLPGVEVAAIHLPPLPAPTAPAEEPVLVWTVNPARIPGLAVAELVEAMRLAGQARITFQVGDANVTAAVA
jgi:hypothetical protein